MPFVSPKEATVAPRGMPQRWDVVKPEPEPSFMDALTAGYQLNAPEANLHQRVEDNATLRAIRPDPEFDALDMLGTQPMDRWENLRDSQSKPEWDARVAIFERDDERRKIIEASGWSGVLATIAGSALTPMAMASLVAFPEVRGASFFARAAKTGAFGGSIVAGEEGTLRLAQPGRTNLESAYVIGGAALLGGVLGGFGRAFGKKLGAWDIRGLQDVLANEAEQVPLLTSKGTSRLTDFPQSLDDMKRGATKIGSGYAMGKLAQIAAWESEGHSPQAIVRALESGAHPKNVTLYTPEEIASLAASNAAETKAVAALMGATDGSVGAAKAQDLATLKGGSVVRRAASMYPVGRLAQATAEFRNLGMGIAENMFRFVSAKDGLPVAMREAAETRMKRWTGGAMGQARIGVADAYRAYKLRVKTAGGKPMSQLEFRAEAGRSIQNGGSAVPEATQAAKSVIEAVFKPMVKEAVKQRLLDPMIHQLASELADMGAIRANRLAVKDLQSELRGFAREGIRDVGAELNRMTANVEAVYRGITNDLKTQATQQMSARLAGIDAGELLARKIAVDEVAAEFNPRLAAVEAKRKAVTDTIQAAKAQYNDELAAVSQIYDFKLSELEGEIAKIPKAVRGDTWFKKEAIDKAERENLDDKSRSRLVYITPEQFLKLATDGNDAEKLAAAVKRVDEGTPFTTVPFLNMEKEGSDFRVYGHEGRHRMKALVARGYGAQPMPVMIRDDVTRWGEKFAKEGWTPREEKILPQTDAPGGGVPVVLRDVYSFVDARDELLERVRIFKERKTAARANMKEILDESLGMRLLDPNKATVMHRAQLEQLGQARKVDLEDRLKGIAADDAVNRSGVIKQVDREYRDARRQIRKQLNLGQRILLKDANKQRREIKGELKRNLKAVRADALAEGKLPTRGEMADSVTDAIAKDIPESYWTPEIADTVRKVKAHMNSPEFHDTYLPRVYDQGKIRADGGLGLRTAISNYYRTEHELSAEVSDQIAHEAYNSITGGNIAHGLTASAREHGLRGTKASMQMQRVLDVPDRVLAPWLHSDIDNVANQYARKMGSRIELSRTSKDSGQSPTAWTLRSDLADAQQRAREQMLTMSPKDAVNMEKQVQQWTKDIEATGSRLTGEYDRAADPDAFMTRLGSVLKNTNYLSRMGGILFSSLSDAVAPVVALGLSESYGKVLTSMVNGTFKAALTMSKAELQKFGTALDLTQPLLTRAADDIEDATGRAVLVAQTGAHMLSRFTGFSHWNSGMKIVSGLMMQDKILTKVGTLSKRLNEVGTDGLTKSELIDLSDMAQLGIDRDMIREMAAQPTVKHGNLTLADSDVWNDPAVVSAYRSAVVKAVDSIIVTPGVGDAPRFIKGPLLKLAAQFQSYNMAAHNRMLIPLMQDPDMARQVSAISSSMLVGALVYGVREAQKGHSADLKKALDDGEYYNLARGVANNMSFLTTYSMLDEKVGGLLGLEGIGRYPGSAGVAGLLGPTAGAVQDVYTIGAALAGEAGLNDKSVTASTTSKMKGLLPFSNHPAMNLMFNETWMGAPAGGLKKKLDTAVGAKETKR
jgi:endonuclease YncB( thermonuclease family)